MPGLKTGVCQISQASQACSELPNDLCFAGIRRASELLQPIFQVSNEGGRFREHVGIGNFTRPDFVGGDVLRLYYKVSIFREGPKIPLNSLFIPHRLVKVGAEDDGYRRSQYCRREEILCEPVCDLTKDVGRGGQNQEHVRPIGQLNVTRSLLRRKLFIQQHLVAEQGDGRGREQLSGCCGHHDTHFSRERGPEGHEVGREVEDGYGAGNSDQKVINAGARLAQWPERSSASKRS